MLNQNFRETLDLCDCHDQYTNSTTVENNEQFENKFEELARLL